MGKRFWLSCFLYIESTVSRVPRNQTATSRMKSSYKRLLPGSSKGGGPQDGGANPVDGSQSPATCSVNLIACDSCRRKKAKCDGQRPVCDRCSRGGSQCRYDADVGESRSAAMKKKYSALNKNFRRLYWEEHQLRRFYGYIRAAPEDEAYNIFLQIRASGSSNPIDVLGSLRHETSDGEMERKDSLTSNEDSDGASYEPFATSPHTLEVPAAPWTTVAGAKIVCELISQYFTYDYLYVFPPINREVFIRDMNSGSPVAATSCSPALVNAICAQQCFLSPRDHLDGVPRTEMAKRFLDEANRLIPHDWKSVSLPTCQAACLIYAAHAAKDQFHI